MGAMKLAEMPDPLFVTTVSAISQSSRVGPAWNGVPLRLIPVPNPRTVQCVIVPVRGAAADTDAGGTGTAHILDDEFIEVNCGCPWWWIDGNAGTALGIDPSPLDARNADRFVDGHWSIISGVERLDLAAGRGLVDLRLRSAQQPPEFYTRRELPCQKLAK